MVRPRKSDPVRDMIRAAVMNHLLPVGNPDRPKIHDRPEGVREIVTTKVDEQTVQIKVVLDVGGLRFFNVKVRETL